MIRLGQLLDSIYDEVYENMETLKPDENE